MAGEGSTRITSSMAPALPVPAADIHQPEIMRKRRESAGRLADERLPAPFMAGTPAKWMKWCGSSNARAGARNSPPADSGTRGERGHERTVLLEPPGGTLSPPIGGKECPGEEWKADCRFCRMAGS